MYRSLYYPVRVIISNEILYLFLFHSVSYDRPVVKLLADSTIFRQ